MRPKPESVRLLHRLSTNTYSVSRSSLISEASRLPFHASGLAVFAALGSNLSTLNGVTGHRFGLYLTPRGEGRILPVFVRASRAEQFVLAAALTPTLRPWWLIHALRALRAIWLPSLGFITRDSPPLLGVAVTFDLTCLRVSLSGPTWIRCPHAPCGHAGW
jgi:hypothetical protein